MTRNTIIGYSLKTAAFFLMISWVVWFGRDLEKGSLPGVAVVVFLFAAMTYETGAKMTTKRF
jgi:hypothetical protein